jgi:ABC-type uncharacterized transport system permease subunit
VRKKWLILLAVLMSGLVLGVIWAGIPAMKRYLKMERM